MLQTSQIERSLLITEQEYLQVSFSYDRAGRGDAVGEEEFLMFNNLFCQQYIASMEEEEEEGKKGKKKDIQKDTLEPVTKVNTKLDKELQEWEVDSTASG